MKPLNKNFFVLLSSLLIFSNRFGFLLFSISKKTREVEVYGNRLSRRLYGLPRKISKLDESAFKRLTPINVENVETMIQEEHYVKKRLTVKGGSQNRIYEELTFYLQEDRDDEKLAIRFVF